MTNLEIILLFFLSDYVRKINENSFFIHEVFTTHYCILTKPITVYKGLCVEKDSKLLTSINGVTSVSLSLGNAFHFATTVYDKDAFGNDIEYNSEKYDSIIVEFQIRKSTRYIPMNICTLQNEFEIIIMNQGEIKVLTEEICRGSYEKGLVYNTLIKYYKAEFIISDLDRFPVYRELPIKTEIKVIDDI